MNQVKSASAAVPVITAGLVVLALLARRRQGKSLQFSGAPAVRAARRLNRAAGVLATSVLADSAVEHYRGAFHNPAMVLPLISSALSLGVSAHGVADPRHEAH